MIEARKRRLQIGKIVPSKGLEALLAMEVVVERKNKDGGMEQILYLKPRDVVKFLQVGGPAREGRFRRVDEDKPTKFELIFEERHDDYEPPPRTN